MFSFMASFVFLYAFVYMVVDLFDSILLMNECCGFDVDGCFRWVEDVLELNVFMRLMKFFIACIVVVVSMVFNSTSMWLKLFGIFVCLEMLCIMILDIEYLMLVVICCIDIFEKFIFCLCVYFVDSSRTRNLFAFVAFCIIMFIFFNCVLSLW